MKITFRSTYVSLLAFSFFLLATSFVLQLVFHQKPCTLCIIDRMIVFSLSFFFLIAILHNPKKWGQIIYCILGFALGLLGIVVSARHLWIIYQPHDHLPACSPGFNYLLETLPPVEALLVILKGSGECAVKNSVILGVPLPVWTLIAFVILTAGCLIPLWKQAIKKG